MLFTSRLGTLFAASAVILASSSAFAAPVYWSNSSGSNGVVSWSDGRSDKGYFGSPTVEGSTFFFDPTEFVSTSTINRAYDTTSDQLNFVITAAPGQFISAINLEEFGAWAIIGDGTVKARGTIAAVNLTSPGFGDEYSQTISSTYYDGDTNTTFVAPTTPTGDGAGTWNGTSTISLPAGVTSVEIVLNNFLQSAATPGSVEIRKTGVEITAVLVPEPSLIGLAGLGGLALLRRRRVATSN